MLLPKCELELICINMLLGLFVLVSYVDDNSTLYCTSEDLYVSLSQATPFCILAGTYRKNLPSMLHE